MRARYYSIDIKGFISVDPIKDGSNWYAYVGGNPVSFVDPLGERKRAPKGSIYVEFDVISSAISSGGAGGWGIINGPGSLFDRLNAQKGLQRITEMPEAVNIEIKGRK